MSSSALLDVNSPYDKKCWTNSLVPLYRDLNPRIILWVRLCSDEFTFLDFPSISIIAQRSKPTYLYSDECGYVTTNSPFWVFPLYLLLLRDLNARIFWWVRWNHLSVCWSPCLFWSSRACLPRWICPCSWSGWRTLSTCTILQSFPHDFWNTITLSVIYCLEE